jgi:hypothetical protein
MDNTNKFNIATTPYIRTLAVIAILLLCTHLSLYCYHYLSEKLPWLLRQLFDVDEENNLPTWFSQFLLLNNAFALGVIASSCAQEKRHYWQALAIGFLILSIDEVAGLHETFHSAIDFNWAIPASILVAIIGIVFIPFLRSLERRVAILYLISGAIFISGALVIELLSEDMKTKSLEYALATALEEGMEMAGALLFLWVNLNILKNSDHRDIVVRIR